MLFCQQARNPEGIQTSWFYKLCTFCWSAQCPIPISAAISLILILSHEPHQFVPCFSRGNLHVPPWADKQYLCPSLKCFTHHLTLVASMEAFLYAWWSHAWTSSVWISSLTRNTVTQVSKITCPCQPLSFIQIWPCAEGRQHDFHSCLRQYMELI